MSLPETQLPLVLRLRDAADAPAWQEFVELYVPFLRAFFQSRGLQPADADDVTQQVCLSIARRVGDWQPDGRPESFRRWLLTIARHAALKFLEQRRRHPAADGGSDQHTRLQAVPSEWTASAADLTSYRETAFRWALQQVRGEFREPTWQAFWRTSIDQESVDQVADSLQLSRGAIYMARSRVMARLRDCVRHFDPDESLPAERGEP